MIRAALPLALPRQRGRVAILVCWFALLAVAAFVWVHAIHSLTNPQRVPVKVRPEAFVWGDRVFHDRARLAQWLHDRGLSYDLWARKHPAAVRILYPATRTSSKTRVRARATSAPRTDSTDNRVAQKRSPPTIHGVSATSADNLTSILMYALALSAVLAAVAITAQARWRRMNTRLLLSRPYLLAGATAITLGTLIAHSA